MEALVLLAVALAIAGVVVLATGGSILEKQNGRYNCHDVTGETLLNRGVMLGGLACLVLLLAAVGALMNALH